MSDHLGERLERERVFHDEYARTLDPALMPLGEPRGLDQAIFDAAGPLAGRRVLDLGCGSGDLTFGLVQQGARVTGIDISAGMIDVARRRAEHQGLHGEVEWVVGAIDDAELPQQSFDLVVGRWILHHLDLPTTAPRIAALLAPGGQAVFAENSGRNRLLTFARERIAGRFGVPRYGTADEVPLRAADVRVLKAAFGPVQLTYPVFDFFRILDRQVFRYRVGLASRLLNAADDLLPRLVPFVRRYSFRVVVRAQAPASRG